MWAGYDLFDLDQLLLTRSSSFWQNLYRGAGRRSLATGYRLPVDTPHFKHSKDTQYMSSYVSAVL